MRNDSLSGLASLFGEEIMEIGGKSYTQEREEQCKRGYKRLVDTLLANDKGIKYEILLGHVLETPLVWGSDLNKWLADLRKSGKIEIPDMKARERVPKKGHLIKPSSNLS